MAVIGPRKREMLGGVVVVVLLMVGLEDGG